MGVSSRSCLACPVLVVCARKHLERKVLHVGLAGKLVGHSVVLGEKGLHLKGKTEGGPEGRW